jgi:geranylgeranylglycerol-phosphate geranylgeranyltransferase
MAFLVTLIGARLAGVGFEQIFTILALACSNAMLCAASMMLNDWHDLAEDRINKPRRVIPSGRLTRPQALVLCWLFFVPAVVMAAWVQPYLGLMALAIVLMSIFYTFKLNGVPFARNLVVAFVSTYPLGCWAPLMDDLQPTFLLLVSSCFVFRIGTEIIKTAEDNTGDGESGVRTVATTLGATVANRTGSSLVCVGLLMAWAALLLGQTNSVFVVSLFLSSILGVRLWFLTFKAGLGDSSFVRAGRAVMTPMIVALGFGVKPL